MKKINEGNGTLNSAEFKTVVDRLNRKEPELDEITKLLSDEEKVGESRKPGNPYNDLSNEPF
jgi:hypothetical protein